VSYGAVSGGGIVTAGGTLSTGAPGAGGTGPLGDGYSGSGGLFGSTLLAFGTAGADVHIAFDANQNFFALGGNDSVEGGGAFDYIDGGQGNDTLSGGNTDQIYGSDGNDLIYAEAFAAGGLFDGQGGIDTLDLSRAAANSGTYDISAAGFTINGASFVSFENLTGTAGDERIIGGRDNNVLDGGAGDDTLDGGNGGDRLTGGAGADLLRGGQGSDVYVNPVLGAGGDTIVEGINEGAADRVLSDAGFSLAPLANVEELVLTGAAAIDGTGNALANFIGGNDGANTLQGGDGNDTLSGGLGADILKGDAGADEIYGGTGSDTLNGGTGNDTLIGGKGNDRMNGGAGADVFRYTGAESGNDRVAGFSLAEDGFDLAGGLFTAVQEAGSSTRLTHAGGRIVVEGITGLSLDDWNATVIGGAAFGGAASSAGWPDHLHGTAGPGLAWTVSLDYP
jgi:Ca2+-binding RTX toxin-like protein